MQQAKEIGSVTSLQEIQAGLERLERRDWWRWAAALLIMLLLTLGMFALSLPGVAKDAFNQEQLSLTVRGLFALVLVFDFFAIYQQVRISRLRKQLAGQIGMHAALEALKSATPEDQAGKKESRRSPRYPFDQRLTVRQQWEGNKPSSMGAPSTSANLEWALSFQVSWNAAPASPLDSIQAREI